MSPPVNFFLPQAGQRPPEPCITSAPWPVLGAQEGLICREGGKGDPPLWGRTWARKGGGGVATGGEAVSWRGGEACPLQTPTVDKWGEPLTHPLPGVNPPSSPYPHFSPLESWLLG